MKTNHTQIEAFIIKAISACKYDSNLTETKSYLAAALNSVSKVSKKRDRNLASQKAAEVAKAKYKEWWEMLKKNAADNVDLRGLDEIQE